MVVKIYGEEITCDRAIKGKDFVKLYKGGYLDRESRVTTFEGYEIIEGEWSEPELTELEIAQLELKRVDSALEELMLNILPNIMI